MPLRNETTEVIETLADWQEKISLALQNMAELPFLELSDDTDSRIKLLQNVVREEVNADFAKTYSNMTTEPLIRLMNSEIQNDFVGGIARDWLEARGSRLRRVFRGLGNAKGMGGKDGVFTEVLLQFMKILNDYEGWQAPSQTES